MHARPAAERDHGHHASDMSDDRIGHAIAEQRAMPTLVQDREPRDEDAGE
jgi:hypothetical protein